MSFWVSGRGFGGFSPPKGPARSARNHGSSRDSCSPPTSSHRSRPRPASPTPPDRTTPAPARTTPPTPPRDDRRTGRSSRDQVLEHRDHPARHILQSRPLDLTGRPHPTRVRIQATPRPSPGHTPPPAPIPTIRPRHEPPQLHHPHRVDDEPRQMTLRQPLPNIRRQQERLITITTNKRLSHTPNRPKPRGRHGNYATPPRRSATWRRGGASPRRATGALGSVSRDRDLGSSSDQSLAGACAGRQGVSPGSQRSHWNQHQLEDSAPGARYLSGRVQDSPA